MSPDELLARFDRMAAAVGEALAPIAGAARRARTSTPGQYAIDLVADAVALRELIGTNLAVLSEESGRTGPTDSAYTVVLDPVDGSTNASRHLPYWCTSICALGPDGPEVALVVNQATGTRWSAIAGRGATRNGEPIRASAVTRIEDSFVALSSVPADPLGWKQCRILGSAALALCDVASGAFDASFDLESASAPWDYLGGMLIASEAGASVRDAQGRRLDVADPDARRQVIAAGTDELANDLARSLVAPG